MKQVLFSAILICLSFGLLGQSSDPQAKIILDEVSSTYRTYKSIQADFELSIENPQEGINETKKGKFFVKGDMFKIDMGNERIVCNGTVLWTHLVDLNEVQISDYDPNEEDALTPNNVFTIYENGYNFKYIGSQKYNSTATERIDLFPVDKETPYFKIELTVAKSTYRLMKAKIFDKNGNHYTYTINNMEIDKAISDSFFIFDKTNFDGIDEIDLRD